MNNQLRTKNLWRGLSLADGESAAEVIDLNSQLPNGYFSLQLGLSGTGTASVALAVSNTGGTYVDATDVVGNEEDAAWSGLAGDQIICLSPPACRYLKITITASGDVTADATLCCQ